MPFWSDLHKREAHLSEVGFSYPVKIPGTPEKTIQVAIEKALPKAELPNLYKATALPVSVSLTKVRNSRIPIVRTSLATRRVAKVMACIRWAKRIRW